MPTYDYECKSCGHIFEYFQSMSDEPLKTCPKCGDEVRRLIGGGLGIIFKGNGFYVTDNKSASKSGNQSTSKTSVSEPAADNAAKTEKVAASDKGGKKETVKSQKD